MVYKNKLLEPGPLPKEIQQAAVFQADANSALLDHSIMPMIINTDAAVQKRTESSQILVNINTTGKGALIKLPSIGPVTAERIMRYRTDFGRFNTIEEFKNVKGLAVKHSIRLKRT